MSRCMDCGKNYKEDINTCEACGGDMYHDYKTGVMAKPKAPPLVPTPVPDAAADVTETPTAP